MQRVQVDAGQVRAAMRHAGLTVRSVTPLSFDAYCLRYLLDNRQRMTKTVARISWWCDHLMAEVPPARALGRALLVFAEQGRDATNGTSGVGSAVGGSHDQDTRLRDPGAAQHSEE
jgi:hypothetical protein